VLTCVWCEVYRDVGHNSAALTHRQATSKQTRKTNQQNRRTGANNNKSTQQYLEGDAMTCVVLTCVDMCVVDETYRDRAQQRSADDS
jgi:hypothetical protein